MKGTEKVMLWLVVLGGVSLAVALGFYLSQGTPETYTTKETAAEPGSDEVHSEMEVSGVIPQDRIEMAPEPGAAEEVAASDGVAAAAKKPAITGRVITEFGEPLAGVEIKAQADALDMVFVAMDSGEKRRIDLDAIDCVSDDEGRFLLQGTDPSRPLKLRLFHDEYVTRYFKVEAGRKEVGDITMELGGAVSGQVVNASGVPIEGAEVYAHGSYKDQKGSTFVSFTFGMGGDDRKAETGPDGFYRITGVPTGKADVLAMHPEHITGTREDVVVSKGREQARVDFTLKAGHTIAGRVVDEEDRPVAGAKVMTDRSLHINLEDFDGFVPSMRNAPGVETDADGLFLLTGLEEGEYTVRVMAPAFLPFKEDRVKTGTQNLLAVMQKGGWMAGHVRDARTNTMVREFEIEVNTSGYSPARSKVLTGEEALKARPELEEADGAYVIEGLGRKPFGLTVSARGYADEELTDLSVVLGEGMKQDVELYKESLISGRLITAAGEPAVGGTVFLQKPSGGAGQDGMRREIRIEATEDAFEFDPSAGANRKTAKSGEEGRFTIRGVKEGAYELTATHEEHTDALPLPVTVDRGEHVKDLVLSLGASGTIQGLVYDEHGKIKAGAKVRAKDRGGHDFMGKMAVSDSEGRYLFKGLAPAEYQLMLVEPSGGAMGGMVFMSMGSQEETPPGASNVSVKEGEVVNLDLYEVAKGSLAGRVTELSEPVEGFTVKLFKQSQFMFMPSKTAQTASDGTYHFKDVPPGDYTVRLDLRGLPEPLKQEITLGPGGHGTRDFSLPSGRVTGRITDRFTGAPVVGAAVTLETFTEAKETGERQEARFQFVAVTSSADSSGGMNTISITGGGAEKVETDADGCYEIRFVKDGNYRVVASGGGYSRGEKAPVEVNEGRTTKGQDLKLERGFTLSGTIVDAATGKAVSFCPYSYFRKDDEEGEMTMSSTVSQGDGTFSVGDLKPGVYIVEATGDEYKGSREFIIKDRDVKEVEFEVTAL
jgi:protocatechuate 3,4-dioxygenase beta subunit